MEAEHIEISIDLAWSGWHSWDSIKSGAILPPSAPGVYEAKLADAEDRLTIGMSAKPLLSRIRNGLVRGTAKHSEGTKIRASEDVSRIVVRWAVTDRPAAAEEELHWRYFQKFRAMPKHCKHCPAKVRAARTIQ